MVVYGFWLVPEGVTVDTLVCVTVVIEVTDVVLVVGTTLADCVTVVAGRVVSFVTVTEDTEVVVCPCTTVVTTLL